MQRNLKELANTVFDVVIIGGGIYGASLLWEATLRGLSAALLEKDDFASATSANSLKTIHGGFRYLQHLDFKKVRQSAVERKNLMRTAPHLVSPLPVLVPAYGHGMKGREALAAALLVYDGLTLDRNDLPDSSRHIPAGKVLSPAEVLAHLPGIERRGLSGGIIFYDAQVYSSERLVWALISSATWIGAQAANRCKVMGLMRSGEQVVGVQAQDLLGGDCFEVRARAVINAAGPWIGQVANQPFPLAKAINIITRPMFADYAVGLMGQNGYQEKDKLVERSSSLLFVTPWRGRSIVGTTYAAYQDNPEAFQVQRDDVQELVQALNQSYPQADLKFEDVTFAHGGMLPATGQAKGEANLLNHYQILDGRKQGLKGLFSVVGVKYTTARQVAEETLDRVFLSWGKAPPASRSDSVPLVGGQIEDFNAFLEREMRYPPCGLTPEQVRDMICTYGTIYRDVLRGLPEPSREGLISPELLAQAQTRYAVRYEMAYHLEDVLLRRTGLASAEQPAESIVQACAQKMGVELKWNREHQAEEIAAFQRVFAWREA